MLPHSVESGVSKLALHTNIELMFWFLPGKNEESIEGSMFLAFPLHVIKHTYTHAHLIRKRFTLKLWFKLKVQFKPIFTLQFTNT